MDDGRRKRAIAQNRKPFDVAEFQGVVEALLDGDTDA